MKNRVLEMDIPETGKCNLDEVKHWFLELVPAIFNNIRL